MVHLEVCLRGGKIELALPQGGSELFFIQLMINETGEGVGVSVGKEFLRKY